MEHFIQSTLVPEAELNTSYEPFSREPEYIELNQLFIETFPLERVERILDLACGTGTMIDLLLSRIKRLQIQVDKSAEHCLPKVVGLDLSRESLLLGQEHLAGLGFLTPPAPTILENPEKRADSVFLIEGTADCLPIADKTMDFVMIGNAIHMIANQEALFSEIARVLRPGGYFAFNTSFYAGTYVPGTEHVYIRWVQEALNYILKQDAALRASGQSGINRKRGQAARAFSVPWLSKADYAEQLARYGLTVKMESDRTVMLNQRCFETIGSYAGLAKVLLSGYPVKLACEALAQASGETLAAVAMPEVPRYWLEMIAQKTGE